MAVTVERGAEPRIGGEDTQERPPGAPLPMVPNLGRTVQVVGPVVNVETSQLPHPKNQRGELGKALFNWYHNTVSKDPLTRVSAPRHSADLRNFFGHVINQAAKGKVNAKKVPVADPAVMTRHIKAVAHYIGADVVAVP